LFPAWVVFHIITCVALVLVVLMQSSKGEGLAGGTAFGGGLTGAVFGGRGAASFLSRASTVLAILFMFNCGALAFMSSRTRTVVSADGQSTATQAESAVTRRAQQERDAAVAAQAAQQEAIARDTTQQQPGADYKITPVQQNFDTTGGKTQPPTQPAPSGTGN
jgi:preprotein translocase subunit SecG